MVVVSRSVDPFASRILRPRNVDAASASFLMLTTTPRSSRTLPSALPNVALAIARTKARSANIHVARDAT